MKVKFLKQHLSYKEGGEYEVTDEQGNYFVSTKVAKEVKEKKEHDEAPAKKEKTEQKHISKKKH